MIVMKLSHDVLTHIKNLELHTRRLLRGSLIGTTRSKVKGAGFEFDQIRDYQVGDDVRCIDWKSSARMNKPLIKQYVEERTKTILIAVDISSSSCAGSDAYDKWMAHADIATILALVAGYCNDMVGLILFSDVIELYIPPARGRNKAHFLIQKLFEQKTVEHKKTNMSTLLHYVAGLNKKNSLLVIISDFIDELSGKDLGIAGQIYDAIAIRCLTPQERSLDACGFLTMNDIETGFKQLIDTRSCKIAHINAFLKKRIEDQSKLFARNRIDVLDIEKGVDYFSDLVAFFQKRMRSM